MQAGTEGRVASPGAQLYASLHGRPVSRSEQTASCFLPAACQRSCRTGTQLLCPWMGARHERQLQCRLAARTGALAYNRFGTRQVISNTQHVLENDKESNVGRG